MKKNLLILLIGTIIGTTITATAAYVYTARDIGYSPSDENWNVTNASDALSSLKSDLNEVNTNVTEYKQQITEALSDIGVEVNESSTMEDITNGIDNITVANEESCKSFGTIDPKEKTVSFSGLEVGKTYAYVGYGYGSSTGVCSLGISSGGTQLYRWAPTDVGSHSGTNFKFGLSFVIFRATSSTVSISGSGASGSWGGGSKLVLLD